MRILLAICLALAAAWAGYWFIGSTAVKSGITAWFDARQSEGWLAEYSDLSVQGFPSRFDTTLTDLRLSDPVSGLGWEAPFFQLLTLSYTPNHVIAVWPHEQRITSPEGTYTLASRDMRASLVVEASTAVALKRATMTAEGLAWTPEAGGDAAAVEALRLAAERLDDAPDTGDARYHLGLAAEGVAPAASRLALVDPEGTLPRVLDTLNADITVDFSAPWDRLAIENARPQPTHIEMKRVAASWGVMTLEGSGTLDVDPQGFPTGTITVKARNWREMLALAERAGALTPDAATMAENALGLVASGSGNGKTLEVPLRFEGGRIWLGPLPIGDAPILRLQ
ncbi:DUF2125 domain-containing protein [Roseovarius arcticus]|uniref:DUF2125 domain-containing protein n=1 Tax=Roseovarius arcticus TaxID=2547404 RepID=UPI001110E196|nr:DUF2125 domain-containing protein [Roseovarius arcticus]